MLLFQTLTATNFAHHTAEEATLCRTARWVYVRSAQARFQSLPDGLRVQSLVPLTVPVFGGAKNATQSSDSTDTHGLQRRSYFIRFGQAGTGSTVPRQVALLQRFDYDLHQLLTELERDYAFELAFRQARQPELQHLLRLVMRFAPGLTDQHTDYAASEHSCWAEISRVPVSSIFSPFSSAPQLMAPVKPHTNGRRIYDRELVLRELATGRLAPLPHPLLDARHVLDGVQPAHLTYPLERLELLPLLVEDTAWSVVKLPGGTLQVQGALLGSIQLFLQVVRPARLRKAAAKASRTVMRVAA